jgi:hypothetical protein
MQTTEIRIAWALHDQAVELWQLGMSANNSEPERAAELFSQAKSMARDCDELCAKHGDKSEILEPVHKQLSEPIKKKLNKIIKKSLRLRPVGQSVN